MNNLRIGPLHPAIWIAIALAALAGITHAPELGHGFINLDDPLYVTGNPYVLSGPTWEGLRWAFSLHTATYWHPLVWLSLMLDSQVLGSSPLGYHVVNLTLHAASVVLFFLLLRSATGRVWPSALAAALLAVHPIHVEAVAWVTARKDVLSAPLFLASALAYVQSLRSGRRALRVWSVLLAILAGMSKPVTLTLPFALLLLDYWPLGRLDGTNGLGDVGRRLARLFREKTPYFAVTLALLVISSMSNPLLGTGEGLGRPLSLRLANIPASYLVYLRKLVWPTDLAVWYSYPLATDLPRTLAALLLLLAITASAFTLRRRQPALLTGWLWFLGVLFPMSGLVQSGMWPALADRFAYLPFMGLYLAIAFTAADLATRPLLRCGLAIAFVSILGLLIPLTVRQISFWENTEGLYRRAIAVAPANWQAQSLLANELFGQGRLAESEHAARQAIRENPAQPGGWVYLARTLGKQGRPEEALAALRSCVGTNPGHPMAHANLAQFFLESGRIVEAGEAATQAIRLAPDSTEARLALGDVNMARGDTAAAIQEYEAALRINPYLLGGRSRLAAALLRSGQPGQALDLYRRELRLAPENPEYLLGEASCLAALGQNEEALAALNQAIAQQPGSAAAWNNLGVLLARLGRLDQAVQALEKALQLDPGLARARASLDKIQRERRAAAP